MNDTGKGVEDDGPLAARAAARLLLAAVAAEEPTPREGASRAALWAHAGRGRGDPVDFAAERAIRTHPDSARLYRKLLALKAVAVSERAMAAHDGGAVHRRVGDYTLSLVEEPGAPPTLVIECADAGGAAPTMIEALAVEGVARLDLPEAVDGSIILDLPADGGERDLMRLLLANPLSGVYLL